MNTYPRLNQVILKAVGVLLGILGLRLVYSAYADYIFLHRHFNELRFRFQMTTNIQEIVICSIGGVLSLAVAFGMMRPRKWVWWCTLMLCPGVGWWFLSAAVVLLVDRAFIGAANETIMATLYGFT